MALDGIVLSSIVNEISDLLVGGRIDKIYQVEKEDLLLTIRNHSTSYRLLLTANSNYPRLHLTTQTKSEGAQPPMFCMILRKHLSSGKIVSIMQPNFERIVIFTIETINELGDKECKKLIIEMMGRHSNIIVTKQDDTIIDSIKHITADKSSVRQILPNKIYTAPPAKEKQNPLLMEFSTFSTILSSKCMPLFKSIYSSYSGLSPLIAKEWCHLADLDPKQSADTLTSDQLDTLFKVCSYTIQQIKENAFSPVFYMDDTKLPVEFYCFPLTLYKEHLVQSFSSVSELLELFYYEKSKRFTISQKTSDIKKLVHTFLDRAVRKKAIQEKALEDAANKNLYQQYGELLTAYAYSVPSGASSFTTLNYYEEPYTNIDIPIDPKLTAIENAQQYFKHYTKAKRTELAAKEQLTYIEEDISYLQSVLISLDILETSDDIAQLRNELIEMGYLKKRKNDKKKKNNKNAIPFLFFHSSSGYPIYVGKNNYQNDTLTMKFASNQDIWLHIKDSPGSHVIIKNVFGKEIDDATLLEAAHLAAYYSSAKNSSNVAIDYTVRKHVKKIPNAKPGQVIYTHFKTIFVTPTKELIDTLKQNQPKNV